MRYIASIGRVAKIDTCFECVFRVRRFHSIALASLSLKAVTVSFSVDKYSDVKIFHSLIFFKWT